MTKTLPVLSFAKLETGMPMPHLLDIQTRAFQALLQPDGRGSERTDIGLERVFKEIFPIQDVNGNYSLEFVKYALGEPKYSVEECIERDMTFAAPLKATLRLIVWEDLEDGERRPRDIIEKEVYLGDLPLLTGLGTFIINGAERVVVSQLVRSPGVYFTADIDPATGRKLTAAKLIPNRGAWLEFETSSKNVVSVKVDRKRRIPVTVLLRAIDEDESGQLSDEELGTDERIRALLADLDTALEVLGRGEAFGIYPEGTRSPDGKLLHRGRTGVARLALAGGVPIVPCGLIGTDEVQPKDAKFPRLVGRPKVVVRFGRPLDFSRHADQAHDRRDRDRHTPIAVIPIVGDISEGHLIQKPFQFLVYLSNGPRNRADFQQLAGRFPRLRAAGTLYESHRSLDGRDDRRERDSFSGQRQGVSALGAAEGINTLIFGVTFHEYTSTQKGRRCIHSFLIKTRYKLDFRFHTLQDKCNLPATKGS